jgi:hypothetical protein
MDTKVYYIQHGYVGNAMCWWRKEDKGYTTNILDAGKYLESVAKKQAKQRPEEDVIWECDYIDNNIKAHKTIIDGQYLDYSERIYYERPSVKVDNSHLIL